MEDHAPIFAARSVDTPEGQVLMLWVNLDREKIQLELDSRDDENASGEG
jgi:hypothetical protein